MLSLKVRIFVNIPEEKPGGGVKIPHVSHIQDKLKRLNAAITAGLKHDQEEKEREEAIRADWQGKDDYDEEDDEEEEERIEEVEALFHEAMLEGSVEVIKVFFKTTMFLISIFNCLIFIEHHDPSGRS